MTDHRYAPGVTKTKGIHAPRDTPLQLEIQTGAGGEGQTLPRKFFRSALVLSFIFSFFSFLSNFSFFVLLLLVIFTFSLLPYVIAFNHIFLTALHLLRARTPRMSPPKVYYPASENR